MRRLLASLAAVMALVLCFAASAQADPLLLYTSQPDEDIRILLEAFKKDFPDVAVRVFRSGTEEVVSKVLAEKMTGRVQADLLLLADAVTFELLKTEGILAPYSSPEAAALPDSVQDPDGFYCGTKMLATVLLYNTGAKAVEPTWKALLAPENADKARCGLGDRDRAMLFIPLPDILLYLGKLHIEITLSPYLENLFNLTRVETGHLQFRYASSLQPNCRRL